MVMSSKSEAEIEADEAIDTFDELVRQRDELRAENEQWRTDWLNMQAENERLEALNLTQAQRIASDYAEIERLRAALRLLAYQADQHPLKIAEISQEVLLDLLARDKCR